MLKRSLKLLLVGLLGILVFVGFSQPALAADRGIEQVFRVYNPNTGEHLYTLDVYERASLIQVGWKDEGVAWGISSDLKEWDKTIAVARLYNPNAGIHHYVIRDSTEISNLMDLGWRNEFCGFPSAEKEGLPVYRLYNPNSKLGLHFFTIDANEKDSLVKAGWKDEGIHFYATSIN